MFLAAGATILAQSGTGHTGDVLGDLIHIKRDAVTGQPILQKRWVELPGDTFGWDYCPIPVDAAGLEVPFLELSCDPDPAYADALVEVDYFGRLSGGRTQERNQRMHFDETINGIKDAERVELEETGRLRLGTDCVPSGTCANWRTIDSPMENLSLYRQLMKYGHLQTDPLDEDTSPGGDPAAGTVYHPALDAADWAKFQGATTALLPRVSSSECFAGSVFTTACAAPQALSATDFFLATAVLAGAADKTGRVTVDLVQYLNRILKITEDTPETLATLNTLPALIRDEDGEIAPAPDGLPWPASERFVDYGAASYLRSDWFQKTVHVLQDTGGVFTPTEVNLMAWLDFINGPMTTRALGLAAFLASAADALRTVQFVHEYALPEDLWASPIGTTTTVEPVTVGYSGVDQHVTLTAHVDSPLPEAVGSGMVSFSVRTDAATPVGVPVNAPVSDGSATATWTLPGGTAPGVLTVVAMFTPADTYAASQGTGTLTIVPAPTITAVMPASVPASSVPQAVTLQATVSAGAGDVVNEGSVLFTVRDAGGATIGTPVSGPVASGAAAAVFTVPGGLGDVRLTIRGDFQGTPRYAASTGTNQLAVGCAPLTILPAVLPEALIGQAFSQVFTSDGLPPVTYSAPDPLPAGLTLTGDTLAGVPTLGGTFTFRIQGVDTTSCSGSRTYTLAITRPALVTGSGMGMLGLVRRLDADGAPSSVSGSPTQWVPFPDVTMGVRVAEGDLTGDGVPDIVAGAGAGGGPHVVVYDGRTGAVLRDFWAFDYYSGGGVFVATGDVNHDGRADVLVTQGHGPARVRVFSGVDHALLLDLSPGDALGLSGARVAAGDVDGDGFADVVLGSGPDAVPTIQVFSGATGALIRNLAGFDAAMPGGVFVAAGDVDGDGRADIVAGAGEGTTSRVRVFSGATLAELRSFTAFDPGFYGGVRVAAADLNGDGRAEIITAVGYGAPPEVRVFDGLTGARTSSFLAYDASFLGGVYIGAAR
ncbi:MAG: FG-GAP-like repeat-containing protein [Vicinamibacterales bacterium]